MAIDLAPLVARISEISVLSTSIAELLEGIAHELDADPDPAELAAAIRANASQLAAALTVGTSHIAVDPTDVLIPAVQAAFDAPKRDRAAHAAALAYALDAKNLDIATELAAVQAVAAAKTDEADTHAADAAEKAAQLALTESALANASQAAQQRAALLEAAQVAVEAKDATIAAKDAVIEKLQAQLDAKAAAEVKL